MQAKRAMTTAVAVAAISGSLVAAATATPADHHTICHATGTDKYVTISPSTSGVFHGHLGESHQGGRDIIPPFEYQGQTYSQNWPAGQEVFDNGCTEPEEPQVPEEPEQSPEAPVGPVDEDEETDIGTAPQIGTAAQAHAHSPKHHGTRNTPQIPTVIASGK